MEGKRLRLMELNKKKALMVKLALLLLLLSFFTAAVVDARFDQAFFFNNQDLPPNCDCGHDFKFKSTTKACCDKCICTKSIPPQCGCADSGETCHSACKTCICAQSSPQQCHCADITDFCYDPCNYSESEGEEAHYELLPSSTNSSIL